LLSSVSSEDILFTDWMVGDETGGDAEVVGIVGIEEVKKRMKEYLVKYNIYAEDDDELKKCFDVKLNI
jgi:hypothetical protein